MADNDQKRAIRAGKAFLAAMDEDPQAQRSLARAKQRLRLFAEGIQAIGANHRQAMEKLERFFADITRIAANLEFEPSELVQAELDEFRGKQRQAFLELAEEIKASLRAMKTDLVARGFDSPEGLEDWGRLARLVEKDPGPMTLAEIYEGAIAWAQREALRHKIARGETPIQAGDQPAIPVRNRSPEDAGIHRDEHDPRIAWCLGKRIYLGDDSQISRLFWLLAKPVGRACSLGQVQRAVDGLETDRAPDPKRQEYKLASQRVRKAISKLRAAIDEGGAADHLVIVRGGNTKYPEYSMVLRFARDASSNSAAAAKPAGS
jgi:hypothetical protein